jgi:fatty-acyl-CoA synthase
VPHDGVDLDQHELRAFLKHRLASYKVPRRILFLKENELTLTGSAKIRAGILRELVKKRLGTEN